MVDNTELIDKLTDFGLNPKEAEVYLTLTTYEWLTALQLSRKCSIKRTTLYRILEGLMERGLIEEKVEDKTTLYSMASVEQLDNFIKEKEQRIGEMRQVLPMIKEQITLRRQIKPKEVSVRFYRGLRGLQYLNLKHTRSRNKEVLIIDSSQWDQALTREFAEDVRAREVKNGMMVREITNTLSPNTSWTDNQEYLKNHYTFRILSKELIEITQDIYIFDDYIQFSGYNRSELVGIEIQSKEYAAMLKQIFEILWKMAKKTKK